MFTNSLFLNLLNRILCRFQNSNFAAFVRDSLIFCHIDILIWIMFILTIISTSCSSSGMIGAFALAFCGLNAFRMLFTKGETVRISKLDIILIIYFLFIFVSLMGSTLFLLSLKGFFKSVVYFLFYFASVYFFLNNKKKIIPTIFLICLIMSYESIVAIMQHFNKVEALAGWVDTSRMSNENQLLSRSFGTLKPSNPNLLGGYLIVGLSSVFTFFVFNFARKDKPRTGIFAGLFVLNIIAIIFTGCRGAYLGLIAFFGLLFYGLTLYVKKIYGGFKNIKKRYKNIFAVIVATAIGIIALTPSISRRFVSIFHFRADSSISFRLNVYEAAARMFQDNPFLGVGVGNLNFREIYGLYMKTGFDALGSYCVPLEVAVEGGIFALLALLAFIFYAAYKATCMFKDWTASFSSRVIIFATTLAILSTMAHGLFDTVWYRPQLQIIFWINVAILNTNILQARRLRLVK